MHKINQKLESKNLMAQMDEFLSIKKVYLMILFFDVNKYFYLDFYIFSLLLKLCKSLIIFFNIKVYIIISFFYSIVFSRHILLSHLLKSYKMMTYIFHHKNLCCDVNFLTSFEHHIF